MLNLGLIQVYTGDGKGKTSASIGAGIRAVGSGLKVCLIQFLKGGSSSEIKVLQNLENFDILHFESERDFFWNLSPSEKDLLQGEINKAIEFIEDIVKKEVYDVLILDEVIGVINNNLIDLDSFISIINSRSKGLEVILTGSDAPSKLIQIADYVSEVNSVKHPFDKGVFSRKGIEY